MAEVEQVSLLESLDGKWLKLPLAVMRDVGSAAQTLGGILRMTNRETFSAVSEIAAIAYLPIGTVRKHLDALDAAEWISNRGREHTRRGRPRRTCTIAIAKKISGVVEPYGMLPWWACCNIRNVGKLPWASKAVLSILMARLMSLKAAAEREDNHVGNGELTDAIEIMGGDERFSFSLDLLEEQTGLHRESIVAAKRRLHQLGIVRRREDEGKNADGGSLIDVLAPNWNFRAIVTPESEGHVHVGFDNGSESE